MKFKAVFKKYRFWWETLIFFSIRVIFDLFIEDSKIIEFGYKYVLAMLIRSMLGAGLYCFSEEVLKIIMLKIIQRATMMSPSIINDNISVNLKT